MLRLNQLFFLQKKAHQQIRNDDQLRWTVEQRVPQMKHFFHEKHCLIFIVVLEDNLNDLDQHSLKDELLIKVNTLHLRQNHFQVIDPIIQLLSSWHEVFPLVKKQWLFGRVSVKATGEAQLRDELIFLLHFLLSFHLIMEDNLHLPIWAGWNRLFLLWWNNSRFWIPRLWKNSVWILQTN